MVAMVSIKSKWPHSVISGKSPRSSTVAMASVMAKRSVMMETNTVVMVAQASAKLRMDGGAGIPTHPWL
jgi:hypothetical protein